MKSQRRQKRSDGVVHSGCGKVSVLLTAEGPGAGGAPRGGSRSLLLRFLSILLAPPRYLGLTQYQPEWMESRQHQCQVVIAQLPHGLSTARHGTTQHRLTSAARLSQIEPTLAPLAAVPSPWPGNSTPPSFVLFFLSFR